MAESVPFAWSKFYSGLAAVISTDAVEVWTRPIDGGLEFEGDCAGAHVTIRSLDADCPGDRSVSDYRLGFVYWLSHTLGVLRPGIVDPPTFAELKRAAACHNPVE